MSDLRNFKIQDPKDGFGALKVVERTDIIELKSAVNDISDIRNVTASANGATITLVDSEYFVSASSTAGSSGSLKSAERGRYVPGYESTAGIGVRIPDNEVTLTGNVEKHWGYFEENNGYLFGQDATGIFVATRSGGVTNKIYQDDWNRDKLNASGSSGLTLDLTAGNIFQINFSWYGYGVIEFGVVTKDVNRFNTQEVTPVHSAVITGSVSIIQPNLPITAEVTNGGDATAAGLYVAGRQFSILGKYSPNYRLTSDFRFDISNIGSTWVPVVSFKRKADISNIAQAVKFDSFTVSANDDLLVGFVKGGTLTGVSWQTPTDQKTAETVLQSDVSATAITGGTLVGGLHLAGSRKDVGIISGGGFQFDIIEDQPVTMVVRTSGGANTDLLSAILTMQEDW